MTEKLTPQQENIFLEYLEKWRKIALSTEPINREKAEQAIKKAYTLIDEPEPHRNENQKQDYHHVVLIKHLNPSPNMKIIHYNPKKSWITKKQHTQR